jgi:hypothetical protein
LHFDRPFKLNENGVIEIILPEKGVFVPESIAKYKNLVFEINHDGSIFLKGSLHVFWNDGKHNYNDFDIHNFSEVISKLKSKFGIIPERTKIRHIEFGLNIQNLPYESPQIIRNIMFHNGTGKPHIFKYRNFRTTSEFKSIDPRATFILKVYDKAKHKDQPGNIFRFECKAHKASSLNDSGITYLADLLKPFPLKILGERLIQLWDQTIIHDWTIRENDLKPKLKNNLKDWRNANFWIELYEETRNKDRNKFSRELKKYTSLVLDHSDNVHKTIKEALSQKWCKITSLNKEVLNSKMVQDSPSIMGIIAPHKDNLKKDQSREPGKSNESRVCKVTGIEISGQKEGSSFLRETTLKTIYETKPTIYKYLKSKFGPKMKIPKSLDSEFEMIAKNIRNQDSNPRAQNRAKEMRQKIKNDLAVIRYQNSLFPLQAAYPN